MATSLYHHGDFASFLPRLTDAQTLTHTHHTMHGHDFLFSLASNKKYIFTYASKNLRLRFRIFVGEPEDGRGPVLVTGRK